MLIARPVPLLSKNILAAIQVVAASLVLGLLAQIKIPLGVTPVPLSFQTFAVMLVSLLLGPRKGPLSVLLYLFEGAAVGSVHLMGPTGGYLLGFFVQSVLIGKFLASGRTFLVLLLSSLVQMGLGVLWLGQFVGLDKALFLGFFPFILEGPTPNNLIRVQIGMYDDPTLGGVRIQNASFNQTNIPLQSADLHGFRGEAGFQVAPGAYDLVWTVLRDRFAWPRTIRHKEKITIGKRDEWVQITVKGDEVTVL